MTTTPALQSRERALVFLSASGPEADGAFRALAAESIDWQAVVAIATEERAIAVLRRRVARCAAGTVPTTVQAQLRALAMIADFEQGALGDRLGDSLDALAGAGVDVMVLKGAGLAGQVYDGFLDRPMIDLDLLVRPEQAERAREVLRGAGWTWPHDPALDAFYASHQHLPPLYDTRGTRRTIELHTSLFSDGHPFEWPVESLWRDARQVRVAGRDALAPSLEHQLLHICVHFAWSHLLQSGAWRAVRDVGAIARSGRLDWDAFAALAERSRAATCCYWTFRMARALAGVRVPATIEARMRPRLPELVLRRLESHFVVQLATRGLGCPSKRLSQLLWELALRPSRSGHGAARPWDHSDDYVPGDVAAAATAAPSLAERVGAHLSRLEPWKAYLGSMLGGRRGVPSSTLTAAR